MIHDTCSWDMSRIKMEGKPESQLHTFVTLSSEGLYFPATAHRQEKNQILVCVFPQKP
jgi:hypothetical protein